MPQTAAALQIDPYTLCFLQIITANQLVREFGSNLDLKKANILNSHFTYQERRQKLPKEIIEKITNRTIKEVNRKNSDIIAL